MGRNRGNWPRESETTAMLIPCIVLSFMTAFGAPKSPTSTSFSGAPASPSQQDTIGSGDAKHVAPPARDSPAPTPLRTREQRSNSIRPMSMVQTYQPPTMEIAGDTIPELQPIFTFLNSHGNKLYQEGYFLKLNDLDTRTSPRACSLGFIANTISQMGDLIMIDHGPSVLPSLSVRFYHCGMPRHLMSLVKMERLPLAS